MPWARASELERHLACPAASNLPRLERGKWEPAYLMDKDLVFTAPTIAVEPEDTSFADWGTAMHAAKAGDDTPPWSEWLEPHRETLWPARLGRHEQCVAYDCRQDKVILGPSLSSGASKAERDAWKAAQSVDCVTGESDWWAELPTGEGWVDDLKTGWAKPDPLSAQIMFYASCRLLVAQGDTVRLSHTWWPRAKEPTEPSREGLWRQLGVGHVEAFLADVRRAWRAAVWAKNHPAYDPRPGAHCLYCKSASVCSRGDGI